jgi:hypothetical protein
MPVTPVTLYAVTCDACPSVLEDDSEGTLFTGLTDIPTTARAYGWAVLGDEYLCPTRDQAHQALIDEHMPPAPVMQYAGQLDLDGGDEP